MYSKIYKELINKAILCREELQKHKSVKLVSHIDADGITAASIIYLSLKRINIKCTIEFVKKLDTEILKRLFIENNNLIIFTDLGSSSIDFIVENKMNCIVLDHHEPISKKEYLNVFKYHMNPHLFGINGAFEISGSGISYIFASQLGNNEDLTGLAIVGAIGDMQNRKYGKLVGLNEEILNIAVKYNVVTKNLDFSLFGKQTKQIHKMLLYSIDPYIPKLTGNEENCIKFLKNACKSYNENSEIYWYSVSFE